MTVPGFDAQRMRLPDDIVDSLRDIANCNGTSRTIFDADFASSARSELDDGPGYVVFTGLGCIAESAAADVAIAVSSWFGQLVPQNASGELVRRVEDRGSRIGQGTSRYSDSRFGGSIHTDGAEVAMPVPDYFILLCVRPATFGGALQIVHLGDILPGLEAEGAAAVLRDDFHFDRRGDAARGEPPTVVKPILFRHGARDGITYLREYVEAGHGHPGVPALTATQRDALDALDRRLGNPSVVTEGTLQPGEIVVVANHRVLHGRTTFEDEAAGRTRLLVRTWVRSGGPT